MKQSQPHTVKDPIPMHGIGGMASDVRLIVFWTFLQKTKNRKLRRLSLTHERLEQEQT